MSRKACRLGWIAIICGAFVIGCTKTPESSLAQDEPSVRAQFAALQAAISKGDSDKIWTLLDTKSQADAEKVAKTVQAAYAKATPEQKTGLEKALGLNGTELAGLTGKDFLRTKRFRGRYRDVPDSTVEKVQIEGESATVHYLETDGDHEKAIFVRQDGQWKVWLTMPSVALP